MQTPITPMNKNGKYALWLFSVFLCLQLNAQLYFPPNSGQWDTISPTQLGWCTSKVDTLSQFLEAANTKSFIVLHNGKIALEKYYGTFTQDSAWYWASAAKSLMAFLIGQAQQEGLLNINNKTSDYLGMGWTDAPPAKENLITVKNQLSMSTGLDYQVADLDCTIDTCLQYKADAGAQWYYHNAPYLLLADVLDTASGKTLNQYTFQKVMQPIGMQGLWIDNLFFSTARNMARFGLLNLNNGKWNSNTLLADSLYLWEMKNSSQNLNPAYGYLWWLNGKNTFIQPGLPNSFNGFIVPSAPADMYMAAGKNDQRIYIVPSLNLVVVRQGNPADQSLLALSGFDNDLWKLLNEVICNTLTVTESLINATDFEVYPNPTSMQLTTNKNFVLYNPNGKLVFKGKEGTNNLGNLPKGVYLAKAGAQVQQLVIQ